jgi:hypothetical protein
MANMSAMQRQVDEQAGAIATLQDTKADAADLLTTSDVVATVEALVEPASNSKLAVAFSQKLDAAAVYTDADATSFLTTVVSGQDQTHALRTQLDSIRTRLSTAETEVFKDCGDVCLPGFFVQGECTAEEPRNCAPCAPGVTYSLGGLVAQCANCTTCPAEHYAAQACTASANTVCAACPRCVLGFTYESKPCQGVQMRECSPCLPCGSGFYRTAPCSLTANTQCTACQVCSGDFEEESPCSPEANAVCRLKLVGFRAGMTSSLSVGGTAASWFYVNNWDAHTRATVGSFFELGTAFNASMFIAPTTGYYYTAAQVRLDGIKGQYFRLVIGPDGASTYNNGGLSRSGAPRARGKTRCSRLAFPFAAAGLHVIRGNVEYNYYSFHTSGTVKLSKGQTLTTHVYNHNDNTGYTVQAESGWSVFQLDVKEGVFAEQDGNRAVTTTGYLTPENWRTDSLMGFLLGGSFTSGIYTVQQPGVFIIAYSQRFDGVDSTSADSYVRAIVAINGQRSVNNGLHAIQGAAGPALPGGLSLVQPAGWVGGAACRSADPGQLFLVACGRRRPFGTRCVRPRSTITPSKATHVHPHVHTHARALVLLLRLWVF